MFERSVGCWLHIHISHPHQHQHQCVCSARNQLKSTFYFYDCTFLRTRAKFILFCVCVSFGICTNKYMRTTTTTKIYGKREAHEYIDTHTFDCKETTHIYDYIRCMRFNIIYLNSGDGVRERVSEIETPTVLLENSLPSIQIIIPSPIWCCVHLIRMSHLACVFFLFSLLIFFCSPYFHHQYHGHLGHHHNTNDYLCWRCPFL